MPYKDPQQKKEWEARHRPQRIARRRRLRQMEAARKEAYPEAVRQEGSGAAILFPILAGRTLAAWSPPFAIIVGGLTLLAAALYKKGWNWWVVGVVVLAGVCCISGGMKETKRNETRIPSDL